MNLNFRLKLGIIILLILTIGSFILPFFTDVNPSEQGAYFKNMPVSADHFLGTNSIGQDIFWYLVFSLRNSLVLGVGVSFFADDSRALVQTHFVYSAKLDEFAQSGDTHPQAVRRLSGAEGEQRRDA